VKAVTTSPLAEVRQRFEREASDFDAIYRLERSAFWRWFNTTFRKAVFERYRLTFEHAGDVAGKSVLDIGCGSGIYAADFARRGARRVLGVDFSENMLALARREAEEKGVGGACEFRHGDFMHLPFDERFDVAIAMGVFDYLPEPGPFLAKMAQVTADGGVVLASFPGHSLLRENARRWRYRLQGKGSVHFYDEADVWRIAREAGLNGSTVVPIRSSGTGFFLVGRR